MKIIIKICGFIMVGIGFVGIIIPGLPTTPFMIIAAFCFLKSSDKMYNWVTTNKLFGKKVKKFVDNKSISLRGKIYSISAMWIMILISVFFLVDKIWLYFILSFLGMTGTVLILLIKTHKED